MWETMAAQLNLAFRPSRRCDWGALLSPGFHSNREQGVFPSADEVFVFSIALCYSAPPVFGYAGADALWWLASVPSQRDTVNPVRPGREQPQRSQRVPGCGWRESPPHHQCV